jgi:predicted PurR-regulated permease PerM
LLPLIVLLLYAGLQVVQQAQQALNSSGLPFGDLLHRLPADQRETILSIAQNPQQLLSNPMELLSTIQPIAATVSGGLLLVSLAVTLTAFLHTKDDDLAAALRQLFGGRDTTAYAYAAALDEDYGSVFFGNFLFVLAMAAIAIATYWTTNLLAPAGLHIPMVFVLGFLTGIASLIPLIVGKIIYLPVVGYLAFQASQSQEVSFAFVGIVLVVYFFLLDFLPQTFIQPYISGRHLNTVMMMFGYLLGPILFGWYGLFLLPMVFIAMVEALRIIVPSLLHGEPLTSAVEMGDSVGTTPRSARDAVPDDGAPAESDSGTSDGGSSEGSSSSGPDESSA